MNRCLIRVVLAAALAVTSIASFAPSAGATYHLNLIREVHEGTGGATGDYVVLQAIADGENLVTGRHIVTYDGGGGVFSDFTFPSNVPNGQSQRTILVANDASVAGADFIAPGALNVINTGGTVCYTDTSITVGIDCVAYGGPATMHPSPPPSPYGTRLSATLGAGQSIVRTISRGCPTALDVADDTNDSAADFAIAPPIGRNNAATPTETPCVPGTSTPARCAGKTATIVGSNASETITGTAAADVLAGFGGKDVTKGLGGKDVICGGAGRDEIVGGKGNDNLLGEGGKDSLKGGPGKDKLKGGPGADTLKGGPGKDKLKGGAGKDVQIQ
jgi:Ca2+-binding RTX toxin-like protein